MNKTYDKPRQHITKQRHYFVTQVRMVKAMVFPEVRMYGCESWTIKKAEHQGIDAFELWCWRRLLRVPWTARRSNQSTLKEISPEYSLEGLMLKSNTLAACFEESTHQKRLMLGKTEGRRRGWQDETVGQQHRLNRHKFEQAPGDGEGQGSLVCCSSWGHKESDTTDGLNNKAARSKALSQTCRISHVDHVHPNFYL